MKDNTEPAVLRAARRFRDVIGHHMYPGSPGDEEYFALDEALDDHDGGRHEQPTVVCLCGSTRFMDAFQKAEFDETLAGRIVLTIGCDSKSDDELFQGPDAAEIKARLDVLHLRKIDLADEVLILNVGGYIGESTRRELAYARSIGRDVRFLDMAAAQRDMVTEAQDAVEAKP